jgi:two-component system chemotaxis response regulator CheY
MFDPRWRVLVVDDMMTMRKIVIKMLKDLGFTEFVEACDGLRGWEALDKASPSIQLIFSDINMPRMGGLDLLRKVRSEAKYREIPFILLTGEVDMKTVESAVESNVTIYLLKPISPDQMKKKLLALPDRKAG